MGETFTLVKLLTVLMLRCRRSSGGRGGGGGKGSRVQGKVY